MNQNELLTRVSYSVVGEEISHELAAKMVKDFNDAHPGYPVAYGVGRNIIEKVLAQPGCFGMRFFNGIDENGKKTMVYAGVDERGNTIIEITAVNNDGELARIESLIGDRSESMSSWF